MVCKVLLVAGPPITCKISVNLYTWLLQLVFLVHALLTAPTSQTFAWLVFSTKKRYLEPFNLKAQGSLLIVSPLPQTEKKTWFPQNPLDSNSGWIIDVLKTSKYQCCLSASLLISNHWKSSLLASTVFSILPLCSQCYLTMGGCILKTLVCKVVRWVHLIACSSWPCSLTSGLQRENKKLLFSLEKGNIQGIN